MKTWKPFLQVLGLQQLRARQFRWNVHFTKNWLLSRRLFCVRKAVTWLNTTIEYGYTLVIKGWTWQQQYSGRLWRLNNAQLVQRGPKCTKKRSPTPLHHHQPEPLRQGRMDPCFLIIYAKFWLYHLNVTTEIETHQTRQHFSNLLLSNFGEPVRIVASVSCS